MKRLLAHAVCGALVAGVMQTLAPTGWWLNSARGVVMTTAALALLAVMMSVGGGSTGKAARRVPAPVAIWAGANIGMSVVLFRVGPGTLFPIVLVIGAGISAAAVAAGSLIGALFDRIVRARNAGS